ncbi:MAG: hypothetical protein FJ197_08545 [Gammaproteobacteria bacterium]|nr:hypothetical protein [Gammaproteobacteria bacterium]
MKRRSDFGVQRPGAARWLAARLSIALAVLIVTGCTAGFVYQRLDSLAAWYVGSYVTLTDAQEERFRQGVRGVVAWHRETQLPRYLEYLQQLSAASDTPFDASWLAGRYDHAMSMLDDLLVFAVPPVVEAFRGLDERQLSELRANLEEENEELWEEYAGESADERRERRLRSALKSLRRFVGPLSGEQEALVSARLEGLADVSGQWIERRRHWQNRFLGLMSRPQPGPAFAAAVTDLLRRPDQFDDGEYAGRVADNRAIIEAMLADLSRDFTDRQRRHLQREFHDMATGLRKLAEPAQAFGAADEQ